MRHPLGIKGCGDSLVQAYCYRICLTDSLQNSMPIPRPERYDSTRYELLLRLMAAQPQNRSLDDYFIWSRMPGRKTDVNNRGAFSTDMIGMNYSYPDASYAERDAIIQAHKDYTLGLLWFMGHDQRVPESIRSEMLRWGLPLDEYPCSGHWTPQLYVRETRRMVGEYVATQLDCEGKADVQDGIGLAAYTMDSHNCQRIVIEKDGRHMVKNEGDVEIKGGAPYPLSYRILTPKRAECTNLLVPVCLSASHIAYGSIRMEPVFMVTGQSAGVAAALAVRAGAAVQDVDVPELRLNLERDPYLDGSRRDVVIDDTDSLVRPYGGWRQVLGRRGYGPSFYQLDAAAGPADSLVYHLPDSLSGRYKVFAYQQLKGELAPQADYTLRYRDSLRIIRFCTEQLCAEGQTSGEWLPLASVDFDSAPLLSVTLHALPSGFPSKADALLLVAESF